MARVHIVISDRNWILERLARELSDALDYVSYDTAPDPSADIQYYMTYGARRVEERVSPFEIAFFTHLEERHEGARDAFFRTARQVDLCVCMSRRYEELLRENAIEHVVTISPGVDLDAYRPKIKIGVVGRTYHTGRKGEALVEQVMDIPELEWHFTGAGWPGPALLLPESEMTEFYNSLDYILVPAFYEGGPMCVLEALACGRPVIAPPVGWVPDYPHIEFKTGDAADLRRVLMEIVEERRARRASVASTTWARWVEQHDRLFREHAPDVSRGEAATDRRIALCIDPRERRSKGGPSVRIPKTMRALRGLGLDARLVDASELTPQEYDLAHMFNVWPPESGFRTLGRIRAADIPVVLSSIFLDLSEYAIFKEEIPRLFDSGAEPAKIDKGYRAIRRTRAAQLQAGDAVREPFEGYFSNVRQLIESIDHVICLSEKERGLIEAIGARPKDTSIVHNPVDVEFYRNADPSLFVEQYGVEDFVLCVGRIEWRKNQVGLLYALRDSDIPIVVVGHEGDADCYRKLLEYAGENVHLIGRLESNSAMLASAYAAARVYVLPSWCEGASLSALEAAAAGCSLVLSDRSSEREYFGDFARYCDPADPDSMRDAVLDAFAEERSPDRIEAQKAFIRNEYSWERYAQDTAQVYETVFEQFEPTGHAGADSLPVSGTIYYDISQFAYHPGPPTGIVRVECAVGLHLHTLLGDRVQFIAHDIRSRTFVPVTREQVEDRSVQTLGSVRAAPRLEAPGDAEDRVDFEDGSLLLMMGGRWITDRQDVYFDDLLRVKRTHDLTLISAVYDVIRVKFPHMYPKELSETFIRRAGFVIANSEKLITDSHCAAKDIAEFGAREGLSVPEISVIRLGDTLENLQDTGTSSISDLKEVVGDEIFVLCVSAIDIRKNHQLLYHIWRRFVETYGDDTPHLVWVGSKSWHTTDLLEVIEHDDRVRPRLHIFHHVDDVALAWLYQHCLFTVYPSLYEGYGIPVAESLGFGKVCVASNASSIPEIAPGLVDLIDPLDFSKWYRTLRQYIWDDPSRRRREAEIAANFKPTTWNDTAKMVSTVLTKPVQRHALDPYTVGTSLDFSADRFHGGAPADPFIAGGWSKAEKYGRWTVGPCSTLGMCLIGAGGKALVLVADLKPFLPGAASPLDVDVFVNGVRVANWVVAAETVYRAFVPQDVFQSTASQRVMIQLRVNNPRSPAEFDSNNPDSRPLGVYLKTMALAPALEVDVFGKNIDLGKTAPTGLENTGWAYRLNEGLASVGPSGLLSVPARDNVGEMHILSAEIAPQAPGMGVGTDVELNLDGRCVARQYLVDAGGNTIAAVLPPDSTRRAAALAVEFHVRTEAAGTPPGIVLRRLALLPVTTRDSARPYDPGEEIAFGLMGNAYEYTLCGWAMPQVQGAWTVGGEASLALSLQPNSHIAFELQVRAKPFLSHLAPLQEVEVFVNDEAIATWSYDREEVTVNTARVPAALLGKYPCAYLRLRFNNPVSLKEIGLGTDDLARCLFVESIRLVPAD